MRHKRKIFNLILSLLVLLNLFGYVIMFNIITTLSQIRDLDRVYLKLFFESNKVGNGPLQELNSYNQYFEYRYFLLAELTFSLCILIVLIYLNNRKKEE